VDNPPTSEGHSLTRIRRRPDSVCVLIRVILDPYLRILYPSVELLSIEHVARLIDDHTYPTSTFWNIY